MWHKVGGTDRIQPCKFFLRFLTYASAEEIRDRIEHLAMINRRIENSIISICYHMRGGVTWEEAWGMSSIQRNAVVDYVNEMNKDPDAQELM